MMRRALLFALIAFGTPALGQGLGCEMFPEGEYRESCIDLANYSISTFQFCEAVQQNEGGEIKDCLIITRGLQQNLADLYTERERTGWAQPQNGSPWSTYNWNSEFTDRPMAMLSTVSSERVKCSEYSNGTPAILLVSCRESEMAVKIITQCFLSESGNGGNVYFRIGQHPAESIIFTVDGENRGLEISDHNIALRLALQMIDSDSAIFQFTPYDDPLATVRFDLTGFAEKAYPIRDACFW